MSEQDGEFNGELILNLPMQSNDADATTVKAYLKALLSQCWQEGEGFSGKRPFGNSGWEYELYRPLVIGGIIPGSVDEYGDMTGFSEDTANEAIFQAIEAL